MAGVEHPIPYEDFRTGLTFAIVKQMMWSGSPDPKDWRYRRRHGVLGAWKQIKEQMYCHYLERLDTHNESLDKVCA